MNYRSLHNCLSWWGRALNRVIKGLVVLCFTMAIAACTTGQLVYTDEKGDRRVGCEVEFVGLPSVDKHAVDYALSFCAKSAVKKGYTIDDTQTYLLALDTQIPSPPCEQAWHHDLAKAQYKQGQLNAREYGYIVAHIDLGLAAVNRC